MTNLLGDLISRGEGGYNSYNRGTHKGHILPPETECDFSLVTIEELTRRQSLHPGDSAKVFAVGKYQIIPTTMQGAVESLRLGAAERFTSQLQERIFADYLIKSKRRPIYDYIADKQGASLHSAQKAASQEWASIDDPDTPGRPYGDYAKHGNRSTIRAGSVADALNGMREAYRTAIRQGISEQDAWRLVTGQSPNVHEKRTGEGATDRGPILEQSDMRPPIPRATAIQTSLRHLGYRGLHESALVEDGAIGPNTLHAIKSFQHAHHLRVDGIVGPRTLAALEEAERYPLLSEATNPHHGLYAQVVAGIHGLPHALQPEGRELENAAVALTLSAVSSGVGRVDHVVLGRDGVNLFAVQGRLDDPSHRRTHVELANATRHETDHRAAMAHPVASHVQAAISQQVAQRPQVMAGP